MLFTKANGEIAYDFKGKLSFSWPAYAEQTEVNRFDSDYQPLLPYGFGLTYQQKNKQEDETMLVLSDQLSEVSNREADELPPFKIFELAVKKPWRIGLQSGDQSSVVISNTQSLGDITLKLWIKWYKKMQEQ